MKKNILFLVIFILCTMNVKALQISIPPSSSKGEEPYNFKIINTSGEAVSGVQFTIYRESLVGGCTNGINYKAISTNDWVTVNMEKDMEVWYVKSDAVPDGYKNIECSAVSFDTNNKKAEIVIYKNSEDSKATEIVGVGYNDFINGNGYIKDIKYAIYLNGNCSGTPYTVGVTNDYLPTQHVLPTDTLMSIKPYEYPQDYLSKLTIKHDKFYCNNFKVRSRLSEPIQGSSVGALKFDSPRVLLFGASEFGTSIGPNGELLYVEEGDDTSGNTSSNNNKINFANFFIDDKMISSKMDVFLENDRTYINVKDLCYYMDCEYEKKNDNIILKFNFDSDGLKNLAIMKNNISKVKDKIKYVITHKVGSKDYSTYLEIKNFKTFALKSPTFKSDSVDVTSKEIDGKIYLPLRFVSEALGRYVEYEPATNGELPNIIISSMGTGEFYEKYSVLLSFDKYNKGDVVKSNTLSNNISLNYKTLYAYGLINDGNIINNLNETIFVPLSINTKNDIDYTNNEESIYKNNITYKNFILKNNSITHSDKESIENELFAVISNIEGYPFIEVIEIN